MALPVPVCSMKPMRDYAAPLVALDQVLEMNESGVHTAKAVAGNEPFFPGHYPDFPIYPGVFIVEAVNQAARLYAARHLNPPGSIRLAQVKSVRFLSPIRPGDRLEVKCRCMVDAERRSMLVQAECLCAPDRAAAQVKLVYVWEG